VICWDPRVSRTHSTKGVMYFQKILLQVIFALRAHCGRDARGPSKSLDWLPKRKGRKPLDLLPTTYRLLPTRLRSRFPTPNVFELFCSQSIDGQTQSAKFQARDLGIDFLGQKVNAGL